MAVITFQRDRPWNFGIRPSEYLKIGYVDDDLSKAVKEIGIDEIDGIFALTLQTPDLKVLSPEELKALDDICLDDDNSLVLTASYLKPAGDFYVMDMSKAKSVLQKMGFSTDALDSEEQLVVSSSPELLELIRKTYSDLQSELLSQREFDIVIGLIYGYPVADSLGFNHALPMSDLFESWKSRNDFNGSLDVLQHVPCINQWTPYWRENVGIMGEKHLADVYREVLRK